jgi:hypothetical protein
VTITRRAILTLGAGAAASALAGGARSAAELTMSSTTSVPRAGGCPIRRCAGKWSSSSTPCDTRKGKWGRVHIFCKKGPGPVRTHHEGVFEPDER